MPDPTYESIIFPLASLPPPLTSLKRSTLTIHNRLASVVSDAEFVRSQVAPRFPGRPLVANERCGSWYVRPADKGGSAYFKSTDGHERAWKFSTRRLNLHLIPVIEAQDGIIVVDSTRRGKRMPDALSTTIPIWCTVLNMALLPSHPASATLHLPPYMAATAHAQITALIPSFVESFLALNLDLDAYHLKKPLRPLWVTQDSILGETAEDGVIFEDYRPVICCTASRRVVGSEVDEGGYIQGAGDDTENWAHGLTAPLFWAHADQLLSTSEADLPDLIKSLVEAHRAQSLTQQHARTQLSRAIAVQKLPADAVLGDTCTITLTSSPTPKESWVKSPKLMEVGLGKSKIASRNLRPALPEICKFVKSAVENSRASGAAPSILVACESGRDLSVGVALAVDCYLLDGDGQPRGSDVVVSFNKALIKTRLGAFMTKFPDANPSRATLQSVNSFLMDWK